MYVYTCAFHLATDRGAAARDSCVLESLALAALLLFAIALSSLALFLILVAIHACDVQNALVPQPRSREASGGVRKRSEGKRRREKQRKKQEIK